MCLQRLERIQNNMNSMKDKAGYVPKNNVEGTNNIQTHPVVEFLMAVLIFAAGIFMWIATP